MGGLARLCKMYGSIEIKDSDGRSELWVWDYVKDQPRLKSEMTHEEYTESERVKWSSLNKNKDEI